MIIRGTYFYGIQILRAILFLAICAFHCHVPLFEIGWGGVETFFVISSFLLVYKQINREEIKIIDRCKHRIKRLYPPYLVTLFACVVLTITVFSKSFPYDFISHLFSLQNIEWMITGYKSPMVHVTAHTWTLSIEVWLGIMWIILLKIVKKNKLKLVMRICVLTGIAYRTITILFGCNIYIVSLCPIAHIDAFGIGSLLAVELAEGKMSYLKTITCIVLGTLGIIAAILMISINHSVNVLEAYKMLRASENYMDNYFTGNIYLFIQILSMGIVSFIALTSENTKLNDKRQRSSILKPIMWLGAQSYILYLLHWPILKVVVRYISSWYVVYSVVLFGSIMCCIIYLMVQHKLITLKGKEV